MIDFALAGKNAIVTGGTAGIGRLSPPVRGGRRTSVS